MKIYIDFDRTLFNTDSFLKDFNNILEENDVDKWIFLKYKQELSEKGFNPFDILKKVEKESPFNKDVYNQIDKFLKNSSNYVYNDALSFLENNKDYYITLLTKGDENFQLLKINNTDIAKYFNDIIVTLKDKGDLNINYQEGIFIDDNPNELASIMKRNPKRAIRIKRESAEYSDINITGNLEVVGSLDEIRI